MSNNNQNIIISSNNISGKCDLKCSYTFKYPETNLTAKNNGSLISLTSDNSTGTPVTYNTEKYVVSNILIVCPSIHEFNNGATAAAEIIIEQEQLLANLGAIPTLEPTQQLSLFNTTEPEKLPDLDPICLKVFQALNYELMGFDSIIQISGLSASEVSGKLLELELMGLVKQSPGMRYQRS